PLPLKWLASVGRSEYACNCTYPPRLLTGRSFATVSKSAYRSLSGGCPTVSTVSFDRLLSDFGVAAWVLDPMNTPNDAHTQMASRVLMTFIQSTFQFWESYRSYAVPNRQQGGPAR